MMVVVVMIWQSVAKVYVAVNTHMHCNIEVGNTAKVISAC